LLPASVQEIWQRALTECGGVADTARLGSALLARLRVGGEGLSALADCGGGLAAHLCDAAWQATDYPSLCSKAATKRYTNGRLSRAMLYVLAGVQREDLLAPPAYLRLLGATDKGREFLSQQRKRATLPVVTKQADIAALGNAAHRQSELAQIAAALYALCMPTPTTPAALLQSPPILVGGD
jgi:predicted nucleotidyltransferase